VPTNLALVAAVRAIAQDKGCTPAQLALAWLLGRWEHIVPIPGTRSIGRLEENAAAASITLKPDENARIEAVLAAQPVAGHRYHEGGRGLLNA
jgi:aryl-alcohol dehydrogenase-like predicted oxidoreductase